MKITDEMLIGDVISKIPQAAEIMTAYGLHCTSCSVNVFEPIKMGAMGHGMDEETADKMIDEINKVAGDMKRKAPDNGIYVSESAAVKIKEFAKNEGKEGFGLKLTAQKQEGNEPAYAMDFQEKAEEGEKTFEFHGVQIFVSPESLENLLGAEVDYLETPYGSGFKIDNPNYKKNCACGGAGGGCGCGGNSCSC